MDRSSVASHGVSDVNNDFIAPRSLQERTGELSVDTKSLATDTVRCNLALSQVHAELDLVAGLWYYSIRVVVDSKTAVLVSSGLAFTTNTCSGGSRLD
jgi:hypothetical protein